MPRGYRRQRHSNDVDCGGSFASLPDLGFFLKMILAPEVSTLTHHLSFCDSTVSSAVTSDGEAIAKNLHCC